MRALRQPRGESPHLRLGLVDQDTPVRPTGLLRPRDTDQTGA